MPDMRKQAAIGILDGAVDDFCRIPREEPIASRRTLAMAQRRILRKTP